MAEVEVGVGVGVGEGEGAAGVARKLGKYSPAQQNQRYIGNCFHLRTSSLGIGNVRKMDKQYLLSTAKQ